MSLNVQSITYVVVVGAVLLMRVVLHTNILT